MADEGATGTENEHNESDEGQRGTNEGQQGRNPADGIPPEVKAALRKANKEAETLRLKLKDLEDRDKSETQRLTDRVEAAEKAASAHEATALRLSVASEKGLTAAQAKRLVGATRDELETDADDLRRDFPAASGSRLAGSADQGTRGTAVRSTDWLQQLVNP